MKKKGFKGSITVFLSLSCILFLALICAVTESARVQGAKTQSANITGMGTFSLLGEFEKGLLEKYEIFGLDGAYGSGTFQLQRVNERFQRYLKDNTDPKIRVLSLFTFDPWKLKLESSEITGYALLTDNKGEAFYQQAVSYMKTNLGPEAIKAVYDKVLDVKDIEKQQEDYEKKKEENDRQLDKAQEAQRQSEEERAAEQADGAAASEPAEDPPENPLKIINILREASLLELLTWDREISDKSVDLSAQPSGQKLNTGTMEIGKENGGLADSALFREYLLRYFSNYSDRKSGAALDYQLEYILGGKQTDRKNLNYVIHRLLLIREGINYSCCLTNPGMNAEAMGLAAELCAAFPPAVPVMHQALMLAWAFGESLLDLRVLLNGGKVPLLKDSESWTLKLTKLADVMEVMREGTSGSTKGLSYEDYLRILLNIQDLQKQKMRGLDMVQAQLRKEPESSLFSVGNCIVALQTSASFRCGQVFMRLPQLVMGTGRADISFTQTAGMAY